MPAADSLHLDTTAATITVIARVGNRTFRRTCDDRAAALALCAQVRAAHVGNVPSLFGEADPKSPRGGDTLTIAGVSYAVTRRYCRGSMFDLSGPEGYRAIGADAMLRGLVSGEIIRT